MRAERRPLSFACALAIGKLLGCGSMNSAGAPPVSDGGTSTAGAAGMPSRGGASTGTGNSPASAGGASIGAGGSGGVPLDGSVVTMSGGDVGSGGVSSGSGGRSNGPPPGPYRIDSTTILAPLVGRLATPAAGQENAGFYASDLGYTFVHEKNLRILFGDTWTDERGGVIDPAADDAQGTISLTDFPRGDSVDAYVASHPPGSGGLAWQGAAPPVNVALASNARVSPITLNRDGKALNMGYFKAPVAG